VASKFRSYGQNCSHYHKSTTHALRFKLCI